MEKAFAMIKPEHVRIFETYEYEGVYLAADTLKTTMDDLKTFEIRRDDIFICSLPKAGSTWTHEIMSAALHDGDIDKVNQKHSFERVPILEMTHGCSVIEDMPRTHKMLATLPTSSPRFMKCHLPGQLLPPQVWEKRIKIVYVLRNPKDVVVSFFHHGKMINPDMKYELDDIFNMFMDGTITYGKWWEHNLYFWKRRDEDHVLFLRFEDMKKDLRGTVKRICEFLGKSFSDAILDAITDHCTFENMKKNPMTNPDTLIRHMHGGDMPEGKSFMRKGEVGNWKAHLSKRQSDALDALCEEKLAGTGLTFDE